MSYNGQLQLDTSQALQQKNCQSAVAAYNRNTKCLEYHIQWAWNIDTEPLKMSKIYHHLLAAALLRNKLIQGLRKSALHWGWETGIQDKLVTHQVLPDTSHEEQQIYSSPFQASFPPPKHLLHLEECLNANSDFNYLNWKIEEISYLGLIPGLTACLQWNHVYLNCTLGWIQTTQSPNREEIFLPQTCWNYVSDSLNVLFLSQHWNRSPEFPLIYSKDKIL